MKGIWQQQQGSYNQVSKELPPIHSAARQGNEKELCKLLKTHPDLVDYGDDKGYTALMHAVFSKNLECVNILLNAGGKAEIKDSEGRTALLFCARHGWSEGCEVIINHGGSCQTVDKNGRNAVHFSACNNKESCLEIILNNTSKEELNQKDVEGMTPLHWASFHNLSRNILLLLEKGADPTILDYENKNPLHWAAQNGCASACNSLLSTMTCKFIINQRNDKGKTPLHFAAATGHLEVIFELAQGIGCDLDLGDTDGRTALHWACAMGEYRCVAGLLRLGVPHHPVDNYGITPMTYAKQLNFLDCVSLFENYNPKKPQSMLIPFENLGNITKNIGQSNAVDDPDNEVFSLIISNEKEKRQTENIKSLHTQIYAKTYEMQQIKQALGKVLQDESFESEYVERNSEGNISSGGKVSRHYPVASDGSGDVSEDEQRYQTQMALSPPRGSLNSSPDFLSKRKELRSGKNASPIRKSSKSSYLQYSLAPLKHRTTKATNVGNLLSTTEVSNTNANFGADASRWRKISVNSDADSKHQNSIETTFQLHAKHDLASLGNSMERPLGLRKKSISMNDGLDLLAVKKTRDLALSRTQSSGVIKQPYRKLPVIVAKNGKNLTQHATRAFGEIDEGYEGFDESSQLSKTGLDFDRRKRRLTKKHKTSKSNFH